MGNLKNPRDVFLRPSRLNRDTSYFEMHLMVKRKTDLANEAENIINRLTQIIHSLIEIDGELKMMEERIRGPGSKR